MKILGIEIGNAVDMALEMNDILVERLKGSY